MVWRASTADLAEDAVCGWDEVRLCEAKRQGLEKHAEETLPIIIGHSSGGGLAQYMLSEGLLKAKALVLCAAVPGQGR